MPQTPISDSRWDRPAVSPESPSAASTTNVGVRTPRPPLLARGRHFSFENASSRADALRRQVGASARVPNAYRSRELCPAMHLKGLPFAEVDWTELPIEEHPGETGVARSRTYASHDVRVRMVDYSPGYLADHWCSKGHVVLCARGEFVSEHRDGSVHRIREGMAYLVGEDDTPHRSSSENGATLFIVD